MAEARARRPAGLNELANRFEDLFEEVRTWRAELDPYEKTVDLLSFWKVQKDLELENMRSEMEQIRKDWRDFLRNVVLTILGGFVTIAAGVAVALITKAHF